MIFVIEIIIFLAVIPSLFGLVKLKGVSDKSSMRDSESRVRSISKGFIEFYKNNCDRELQEKILREKNNFKEYREIIENVTELHGKDLSLFCNSLQAETMIALAKVGKLHTFMGEGFDTRGSHTERLNNYLRSKISVFFVFLLGVLKDNGFCVELEFCPAFEKRNSKRVGMDVWSQLPYDNGGWYIWEPLRFLF